MRSWALGPAVGGLVAADRLNAAPHARLGDFLLHDAALGEFHHLALRDEDFREGILREGIECMLGGDIQTGKALLRDYINATVGFEKLAHLTKKESKSLMRMFSEGGNPTANNLFEILSILQKKEGIHYELQAVRLKTSVKSCHWPLTPALAPIINLDV